MGAWGVLVFEDDGAIDWTYDLDGVNDLTLVESTFNELEAVGNEYLEQGAACKALAACELIARLKGNIGYSNSYTEKVDEWVKAHPIMPSSLILTRARAVVDRVFGANSELRDLWVESGYEAQWHAAIKDLYRRLQN